MKRFLQFLTICLLLLPLIASADTLSWTNPTTYTDNTLIPASVLAQSRTRVLNGPSSVGPWTKNDIVSYPGNSYDLTPIEGQWYTAVFIIDWVAAGNPTGGDAESDFAVPIQYHAVITPPPPPPPPTTKPKIGKPPSNLNWKK
jgi:hypothetical protein